MRISRVQSLTVGVTAAALLAGGVGTALAATAHNTTLTITTASKGLSTTAQAVSGTLKSGNSGLAGQVVRLVGRTNSGKYSTLSYAKTNKNGVATFSIKPAKGRDNYKLVFNGSKKSTPSYAGSHSATETVTVSK